MIFKQKTEQPKVRKWLIFNENDSKRNNNRGIQVTGNRSKAREKPLPLTEISQKNGNKEEEKDGLLSKESKQMKKQREYI